MNSLDMGEWFEEEDYDSKREGWTSRVRPACCSEATNLTMFAWPLDDIPRWHMDEGGGGDGSGYKVRYCPWCGHKLPTAEELHAWLSANDTTPTESATPEGV